MLKFTTNFFHFINEQYMHDVYIIYYIYNIYFYNIFIILQHMYNILCINYSLMKRKKLLEQANISQCQTRHCPNLLIPSESLTQLIKIDDNRKFIKFLF